MEEAGTSSSFTTISPITPGRTGNCPFFAVPPAVKHFPAISSTSSRLLERATHLRKEREAAHSPPSRSSRRMPRTYRPISPRTSLFHNGRTDLPLPVLDGVLPPLMWGNRLPGRREGPARGFPVRCGRSEARLLPVRRELESFARFGARLDDDTRKTMAHGRRIRGSLKQPEFSPISVPAQIAILLAISAELFDEIPLNRIDEAERAVQQAAEAMPDDLREHGFSPPIH